MSGFTSVIHFLLTLFFNLAFFVLWIRLALRYFRVSALHPVSQVIYSLTNPVIQPIERLIYPEKSPVKRYDWICFALIVILELIKFTVLSLLIFKAMMPVTYLILFALVDLIIQPCNLLFYLILIRVIMSWVNPTWHHPVADIMRLITEPLLSLGRQLVPNISGFDFSPFIILIILEVVTLFLRASLPFNPL